MVDPDEVSVTELYRLVSNRPVLLLPSTQISTPFVMQVIRGPALKWVQARVWQVFAPPDCFILRC